MMMPSHTRLFLGRLGFDLNLIVGWIESFRDADHIKFHSSYVSEHTMGGIFCSHDFPAEDAYQKILLTSIIHLQTLRY